MLYYLKFGRRLNLKNPKTFNEKLQWLKLYDRKLEYTTMVDKYKAKKYVADKIGEEFVIPTLGVWENFDEIDFDKLPNQFVLKTTHDSSGVVICKNKADFDKTAARKKLEGSLKTNYFYRGREWPYKDVKPRIIAEQYLLSETENWLTDYKFFCFNGEPMFLYVSKGLENHSTANISFLTLNWEFESFKRDDYKGFDTLPPKPKTFDQMLRLAKSLSKQIPFLRVDFYENEDQTLFSELTFYPCSGYVPFDPVEWDEKLGGYINLPNNNSKN